MQGMVEGIDKKVKNIQS